MTAYHLGWFSTGRDKAARDLLTVVWKDTQQEKIKAEISFVFSNRERGESKESDQFFALVKSYNIPLLCLSSQRFKTDLERLRNHIRLRSHQMPVAEALRDIAREPWRLEYERRVMKNIEGYHPYLCVLVGYMLIVGKEMCQRYKMINLHPAAPGGPTGTWQEVIWKLIEARAESTGVMMHLVTPELDKGPAVTFCTFSIRGKPFDQHWRGVEGLSAEQVKREQGEKNALFKLIREQGLAREFPLITATIRAFSEGRVRIEENRVVGADGKTVDGYDLTAEIDKIVQRKAG